MTEKILAGLVLAACVVMLLRMALSARRRDVLDRRLRAAWHGMRQWGSQLLHGRARHRAAQQAAQEAIRRAQEGRWDGNVYRPDAFRKPRKPREPH